MTRSLLYQEIIQDTIDLVARMKGDRVKTVPLSPETAALLDAIAPASGPVVAAPAITAIPSGEAIADDWAALEEAVRGCTKCGLCATRTQTVFGVGNREAELVFVGEAPGADEDRQGEPFVGKAGRMLTDIITKGMKLRREEVFICNILKCRPPGNRTPNASEVAACTPHLVAQLSLLRPKAICALGGVAAQFLLQTGEAVGRLRGRWHEYQGIPLRVTYHPSYLIRLEDQPARFRDEKRKVWEDIQEIMKLLAAPQS